MEKSQGDPSFTSSESQVLACKLRLVNCLRRQRDFAAAEQEILDVIKASPNAPDAQFEAARVYQEWGNSGGVDSWKKFETALKGVKEPIHVWGWGYTAQSLQRAVYGNPDERLEKLHFDARYNLAECELQFGKVHPDVEEGTKHLERARAAIVGFQAVSKKWPEEEYARFNELYRSVLTQLGSPVVDLPREGGTGKVEKPEEDKPVQVTTAGVATPTVATTEAAPKSNAFLMLGMIIVGGALVAGLYFMAIGGSKKKYAQYADSLANRPKDAGVEKISFAGVTEAAPKRKKVPTRTEGQGTPPTAQKRVRPPEQKPATGQKRPATGQPRPEGAPPRKKRPPTQES